MDFELKFKNLFSYIYNFSFLLQLNFIINLTQLGIFNGIVSLSNLWTNATNSITLHITNQQIPHKKTNSNIQLISKIEDNKAGFFVV